ncbi:hypothetical protein SAMN05421693_11554 [Ectothiorhodospira magna]|uniref:Uncharacterized protein n=1 Tax=Ectothiorhodospira magna TaxID=867345 RepID=A0A1H9CY19_9GAMM|nr:hypothetical protein [Ectothiorhodospira magna]SEQ06031.1 hypothetical protein SAMN05421693_11554 [Ectothiorhodospira magna]
MAFSIMGLLAVVLEFFRGWLWFIGLFLLLDFALTFYFLKRSTGCRTCWVLPAYVTIGFGVFIFILSMITLPTITKSSWAALSGIDYLALIGASIGFGALFAILAFPFILNLLGIRSRPRPDNTGQATRTETPTPPKAPPQPAMTEKVAD